METEEGFASLGQGMATVLGLFSRRCLPIDVARAIIVAIRSQTPSRISRRASKSLVPVSPGLLQGKPEVDRDPFAFF